MIDIYKTVNSDMNIMHVIDTLEIGGKERVLIELANASVKAGYKISVCVTRKGTTLSKELHPNIPIIVLDRHQAFDIRGFQEFLNFVKELNPDVFHVHGRSSFSFVAFLKTFRKIAAPVIFHDHYGGIEVDQSIPLWFRMWGHKLVDAYVGVYEKLTPWAIRAGVPAEKVSVIENGTDLDRFQGTTAVDLRNEFDLDRNLPLIGVIVGRICYEKGVDNLLKALSKVVHLEMICLLWIGPVSDPKYYQECLALRDKLGLQKKVLFVGKHTNIPSLLNGADFAISPSISESGPLILIEYMASGLPFVASRVGNISQRSAECGMVEFIGPCDIQALADGIDRLVDLTSDQRVQRGATGREFAFIHFDIKHVMKKWSRLYNSLVDDKK